VLVANSKTLLKVKGVMTLEELQIVEMMAAVGGAHQALHVV